MRWHRFYALIFLGLILALPLSAQQSNWQNLAQVRPGDRIELTDMHLKVQSGDFVSFTESDLTMRVAGKEVVMPKEEVYRVTVHGRGRGRHVLRGLLIGGAIGGGIAGIVAAKYPDQGAGQGVAAAAMVGGGIGAGIGAAKPGHLFIYRAAEKPKK